MIRVLFLFVILSVLCYLGIKVAENLTGKQMLRLTKVAGYVIISSALALGLMLCLVVFF